jgi:hypothetical protein
MASNYTAGLARAAEIVRSLAQLGRNCGQKGAGPDALDAAAAAIDAEADEEVTPAATTVVCELCGGARRLERDVEV